MNVFSRRIANVVWISMVFVLASCQSTQVSETASADYSAPARSNPQVPAADVPAFVDKYQSNVAANAAKDSNALIALFSTFDSLWTPGTSWDNGTPVNKAVLDKNIQYVVKLTANRTGAQETRAYLDDRRNQSYSVLDGLGPLAPFYISGSGAATTILSVAPDTVTVKYDDKGNGAGLADSKLGSVVTLINTVRGNFSSTNPSKGFYQYPRPWRQSENVIVVPALVPAKSSTPATDGGFPSGHSNASYLAALALAYAVPERFQELLTRASELGESRILAGMHSPLDVIGGRISATALSAAILADPANASLKAKAYADARTYFLSQTGATDESFNDLAHSSDLASDRFADYAANKANFVARLTFGFDPSGKNTALTVVPKGAEVLLETRLPYLTQDQRREVLRTTALASGYPILDDAEGWGRLNLFAAADGYGAFADNVTVDMDADKGGFNARDLWRNDISGPGRFTKTGSGALGLAGRNSYSGTTLVDGGTLAAHSASAFGTGTVIVKSGTLAVKTKGGVEIGGNLDQLAGGTIAIDIQAPGDGVVSVKGAARLAGKLTLHFSYVPAKGTKIDLVRSAGRTGTFSSVEFSGLPANPGLDYTSNGLRLSF